jgi:hypothetical protein
MTFAGKSLFKLIIVLPRCPLALGSCSSETQFGFFQFGHTIAFMIFGLSLDLGAQCTLALLRHKIGVIAGLDPIPFT